MAGRFLERDTGVRSMSTLTRAATVGNVAASGMALLLAAGTIVAWAAAIGAWGTPRPYATAMTWTLFMFVAFGVVMALEWLQNAGGD